jgi:hypothetical protein
MSPKYVAILLLAALGLLAFMVASWGSDAIPPPPAPHEAPKPPSPAMSGLNTPFEEYAAKVNRRRI